VIDGCLFRSNYYFTCVNYMRRRRAVRKGSRISHRNELQISVPLMMVIHRVAQSINNVAATTS
jgi:hypothetical protein